MNLTVDGDGSDGKLSLSGDAAHVEAALDGLRFRRCPVLVPEYTFHCEVPMFGWGQQGRIDKLVKVLQAGSPAKWELQRLSAAQRPELAVAVITRLQFEDQPELAQTVLDAALESGIDHLELVLVGEGLLSATGKLDGAIALLQAALDSRPDSESLTLLLAGRLIDADREDEALELLDVAGFSTMSAQVERARALLGLGRDTEAMPILEVAIRDYERAMSNLAGAGFQLYQDGLIRARQLHDAAFAEQHGPEAVITSSTHRHKLSNVGGNYRLLAESLMVETDARPASSRLEHPRATLQRLGARARKGDDAGTLALRGSALLRLGRVEPARAAFEAACEADGRHFAGYRGLAAALDFDQLDLWNRASQLPASTCPPLLPQVVPDFAALTELEQRVVCASLAPLSAALPLLAGVGAQIRLLPIDVRTVDLPEWQADEGARFTDDLRAMDALGGVASSQQRLAAARVEALLDVVSEAGFVFGHEFAHLAFFELADQAPVLSTYQRASQIPYLASSYQMSNEHEFFACAYQDFLREHYALRTYREADDQGVWRAIYQLFDVTLKEPHHWPA